MENSLLFNFGEIWPETMYYSTGTLTATLKIHKKSNFDQNQLKHSTQHKYMYMYQKKIIKIENSLLFNFGEIWPETMYYSTGTFTRFWSNFKIHKKSNFDRNQFKLSTQHKNMYMYQKKL